MTTPFIVGLLTLGVPLALVGLMFLRKSAPILMFYLVAAVIGLGYLTTTEAVESIGAAMLRMAGAA